MNLLELSKTRLDYLFHSLSLLFHCFFSDVEPSQGLFEEPSGVFVRNQAAEVPSKMCQEEESVSRSLSRLLKHASQLQNCLKTMKKPSKNPSER